MNFARDLRSSTRLLLHEPGFTLTAVLTIALGIGVNTAIFSIVNAVLLRPLPYAQPDRLVTLREVLPALAQTYPTLPVNARHFLEWRANTNSFESLSAVIPGNAALTGQGEPEQLDIANTSANLFDTLGIKTALGRTFAAGEDEDGHNRVAVVTDSLWRRRFNADPSLVGRGIKLDGLDYTVIGILPSSFRFPSSQWMEVGQASKAKPEVFKPLVFSKNEREELMGTFNYAVIARLKPEVEPERARSELNVIAKQIEKLFGQTVNLQAAVFPLRDSIVGKSRRGLLVLLGAVGSVLLIVCVNLANLLLARSERRSREWAVRTALGASRASLLLNAIVEAEILAIVGGVLGLALASATLGMLVHSAPADIPRLDEVRLDPTVLLFALALAAITGLLFGLVPAWRATRIDPQDALRAGGRSMSGTASGARIRSFLVAAETGLSVLLLVTAALLMSSFGQLLRADKGFNAPTTLAGDVRIPLSKYKEPAQRDAFYERVIERLRSQPGIMSAAIVTALPLTGETWVDNIAPAADNRPEFERPPVNVRFASADYFKTMGIPLLAGRSFNGGDRKHKVAVVSEKIAKSLWPGKDPLGRSLNSNETNYEVIGVVGDVRAEAHRAAVAVLYRPYWDWSPRQVTLVAKSAGDARAIAAQMREAVRSVDSEVPLPLLETMQDVIEGSLAQRRFQMLLAAAFAATALLLSAMGIYAVVAYSVTRRRNEMGVRTALGASSRNLYFMVTRQAMRPVVIGMIVGIAAALAAGRVLTSLLYEVRPGDPTVMVGVVAVLLATAVAACLIPALRAGRVPPVEALRYE